MQRKGIVWVTALVAGLVAAAVAGATTTAGKGSKDVTLNLVAYSTPRPVLTKLIDEFQQDAAGRRHHHPGVLRPVLRPGSGGRERAAGRRCHPQHGERHQRPRRQGADQQELGQAELQRRRLELGRGLWPPRRQPEEDQGLERPDQARRTGRDGEPVHRGDREVEHPRRPTSRSAGSARPTCRRIDVGCRSSTRATSSRRTRPARTRRTRSSRARATCCSRSRARRSTGSIPYVIPRQTMLIDVYIAAIQNEPEQGPSGTRSRGS